ncbi:MAG TPA: ATP-binding protein [Thermogutta sp.]|nr:ATP-binding protein [Thermogutta sp.]
MKIVIASGKGGTGKTTVATNLAFLLAREGLRVAYVDCDVEEPNGHLFLQPVIEREWPIEKPVPVVESQRCTQCGRCSKACRFGAIISLPQRTVVFPELCHACGGCQLACPAGAISEKGRRVGTVRAGYAGTIQFLGGELDIGQPMSPPIIRALKETPLEADLVFLDAPPGTSCPVVETLRGADMALLVTEPTPFGLYDLQLAIRLVRALSIPAAVIVNRVVKDGEPFLQWRQRLKQLPVPVWAEIPESRAIAEAYSSGTIIAQNVPEFARELQPVMHKLKASIDEGTCRHQW